MCEEKSILINCRAKRTFKDRDGVVVHEGDLLGELYKKDRSDKSQWWNTVQDGCVTAVINNLSMIEGIKFNG